MLKRWAAGLLAGFLLVLMGLPMAQAAQEDFGPGDGMGYVSPPTEGVGSIIGIEQWDEDINGPHPAFYYNFDVYVLDEDKNPLSGVKVELYRILNDGTRVEAPITGVNQQYLTDEDGKIRFRVPGGIYEIETDHVGYQHFKSIQFVLRRDNWVIITLKKHEGGGDSTKEYTVTYQAGANGTLSVGKGSWSERVKEGETPQKTPTPQPNSGYRFLYWTDHDGVVVRDPSKLRITGDTVLTAQFAKSSVPPESGMYTVYYLSLTGGSLNGVSQESVTAGQRPQNVPSPVAASGYRFLHWKDQYGHIVSNPGLLAINQDTWLYAVFEQVRSSFTVYYGAGSGGRLDGVSFEVVQAGGKPQNVPRPVPTLGFRFIGWVDQNGKSISNPSSLTIWADTWLFARFENTLTPDVKTHTVYYWVQQGGILNGRASETVVHGGYPQYTPTPTPNAGYVFTGWMDQWGNAVKAPSRLPITEDIWLQACFQAVEGPKESEDPAQTQAPAPSTPPRPPSGNGNQGNGNQGSSSGNGNNGSGTTPIEPIDPEPGTELPPDDSGEHVIPPTQDPGDQQQPVPARPLPEPEEECWLHWVFLAVMAVGTLGGAGRLWYLFWARQPAKQSLAYAGEHRRRAEARQ